MNKTFKQTIAALTLSVFAFGTGSALFPASALAAPSHPRPIHHDRHHSRISKTGAAILGTLIIGAVVANSVQHHKDKKAREQEYYR